MEVLCIVAAAAAVTAIGTIRMRRGPCRRTKDEAREEGAVLTDEEGEEGDMILLLRRLQLERLLLHGRHPRH